MARWFTWPRRQRRDVGTDDQIPPRGGRRRGRVQINEANALTHSAVWAACRLRADLVSTLPVDLYRRVDGIQVEVPKGPILTEPGGPDWDLVDWLYASQFDLDRAGNAIGLITERAANNLPTRIELQDIMSCTVIKRKGEAQVRYRIDGTEYTRDQVWHERQYVIAGCPVGLSPTAHAAMTLGEYLSAQEFALDWFRGGGVPKAKLRNKEKRVPQREAAILKGQWRANMDDGDLFVTGNDWEYEMVQAQSMGMEWLESRRFGLADAARFYGVPADLIEAAISAPGSITYQSGLARNLQFLTLQLEPAIRRREKNLSKLHARPRYVKMNEKALLRMDPEAWARYVWSRIQARTMTPDEARDKDDMPPLTDENYQQFFRLFGEPNRAAAPAAGARQLGPQAWWEAVSPYSAVPYVDSEVRS